MAKPSVTGNLERLRQLGFTDPEPPAEEESLSVELDAQPSIITRMGLEKAPIEDKAKALTEKYLDGLTEDDLRKMGATGAEKIAKIAGIGGAKKLDPSTNPIIAAIILGLSRLGVKAPEMQVIEPEPPTLEAK